MAILCVHVKRRKTSVIGFWYDPLSSLFCNENITFNAKRSRNSSIAAILFHTAVAITIFLTHSVLPVGLIAQLVLHLAGVPKGVGSKSRSFPVLFAFLLPSITLFFFTLVDLWLQFQGLSPDSEDCHTNFTTHFQDYLLNARMLTSFVALMFVWFCSKLIVFQAINRIWDGILKTFTSSARTQVISSHSTLPLIIGFVCMHIKWNIEQMHLNLIVSNINK